MIESPKTKRTRMLLTLPNDLAAAIEAEAQIAALRPTQIARSLIARALRERPERHAEPNRNE